MAKKNQLNKRWYLVFIPQLCEQYICKGVGEDNAVAKLKLHLEKIVKVDFSVIEKLTFETTLLKTQRDVVRL